MAHFNFLELLDHEMEFIYNNLEDQINNLQGKSILITGSSGLIGKYLINFLNYLNLKKFKESTKIICVSRSSQHKLLLEKKDSHANITFINHNIVDPLDFAPKIDYAILAAGNASPATFLKNKLATFDTHVIGTKNTLNLLLKKNILSCVYLSSGAVYGDVKEAVPISENNPGNLFTLNERACYGESKRMAETLCSIYNHQFNLPIKIARLFVCYGPGIDLSDNRVLSNLLHSALFEKQLILHSDGNELRTYLYLSDAIIMILKLLLSNKNNEIFNIGSQQEIVSLRELATKIMKVTALNSSSLKYNDQALRKKIDAPLYFVPDMNKFNLTFNFTAQVNLLQGLISTIAYLKFKNFEGYV